MKNIKNEKGSITAVAVSIMVFILFVLSVSYFAMSNKAEKQRKNVNTLQQEYYVDNATMAEEYKKVE